MVGALRPLDKDVPLNSFDETHSTTSRNNVTKQAASHLGLYAGSNIPREMHLDLKREEIQEYGKEIVQSLRFFVPEKDDTTG